LSTSGAFQWGEDELRRPDLAMASPLKRLARTVNMCELGEALEVQVSGVYHPSEHRPLTGDPGSGLGSGKTEESGTRDENPPVKALLVYNSNPGSVAPDQNAVKRGLSRADLFTVVHELFFNDTTDYADYVLPATTFLEHTDIQGAYGHYFVQLSQQAIEPPGEARPNVWLFGQLGQRMGFKEACFRDTPEEMVRQALRIGADGHSQNPGMEHITLEDLKERGHIPLGFHRNPECEPFLPFVEGTLATLSGKIEFDSEVLKARGADGLPGFKPPTESRWGEDAKRYPLEFLSRKADNYMNSTFANLDGHRKMEARTSQRLEMHPTDAAARGIGEGDAVRIWNDRGEIRLTAMMNAHQPAGVVAGKLDWSKMNAEGNNVNALTSQRLTDIGAGATFYSTLVEVKKDRV
jgi:anaerobic selenocysteine-containing dehydrogenase